MIPNMFKIAGELTSFCMHVSARTVATHALSIFGDHSDVMACRRRLCHAGLGIGPGGARFRRDCPVATLRARVPFLHFFDASDVARSGKIELIPDDDCFNCCQRPHRGPPEARADARRPRLRGTAQNPTLLPGSRGLQPLLRRVPHPRAGRDGSLQRNRRREYASSTMSAILKPIASSS